MCNIPAHPEVPKRFPNTCRAHDPRITGDTPTTTASAQTHTLAWLPACLHQRRKKGQSQEEECLSSGVRAVPRSESRAGSGSEPETKKKKKKKGRKSVASGSTPLLCLPPSCHGVHTISLLGSSAPSLTHTHGPQLKGSYERFNTSSHSPA